MSQWTTDPSIRIEVTKQKILNQTNSESVSTWNTVLRNKESGLKDLFDSGHASIACHTAPQTEQHNSVNLARKIIRESFVKKRLGLDYASLHHHCLEAYSQGPKS